MDAANSISHIDHSAHETSDGSRGDVDRLSEFPDELLMEVFERLSISGIGALSQCNRTLRRIGGDHLLWKRKAKQLKYPADAPLEGCSWKETVRVSFLPFASGLAKGKPASQTLKAFSGCHPTSEPVEVSQRLWMGITQVCHAERVFCRDLAANRGWLYPRRLNESEPFGNAQGCIVKFKIIAWARLADGGVVFARSGYDSPTIESIVVCDEDGEIRKELKIDTGYHCEILPLPTGHFIIVDPHDFLRRLKVYSPQLELIAAHQVWPEHLLYFLNQGRRGYKENYGEELVEWMLQWWNPVEGEPPTFLTQSVDPLVGFPVGVDGRYIRGYIPLSERRLLIHWSFETDSDYAVLEVNPSGTEISVHSRGTLGLRDGVKIVAPLSNGRLLTYKLENRGLVLQTWDFTVPGEGRLLKNVRIIVPICHCRVKVSPEGLAVISIAEYLENDPGMIRNCRQIWDFSDPEQPICRGKFGPGDAMSEADRVLPTSTGSFLTYKRCRNGFDKGRSHVKEYRLPVDDIRGNNKSRCSLM